MADKKQMMDIRACKGFTVQESNEHRRNWDDHRWQRALNEGNYDLSRQHLNFEIVKGGKIQPIDKTKSIPQMMKERLDALGIKDPNQVKLAPDRRTVVEMVLGGNRERMLELAFVNQDYDTLSHTKDHSHLRRMPEIEEWAKDVYDWCCRKWGEDNILSFVAHHKEHELEDTERELAKVNNALERGEGDLGNLGYRKQVLEAKIEQIKQSLDDKRNKLAEADREYQRVRKALNAATEQLQEKSYFKINTHYLTNNSQLKYLSEIVRIAKDRNMAIRVIGAADSVPQELQQSISDSVRSVPTISQSNSSHSA